MAETVNNGNNSYSLKEMITTLSDKVDNGFSRIEGKLDDLKDSKADKVAVQNLEGRVRDLERQSDKDEGVAAFKKWLIPIIVSATVSLIATLIYVHGGI